MSPSVSEELRSGLPYLAPMLAFGLTLAAADYAPEQRALELLAVRALVPLAVFLFFLRRGSYPELRRFSFGSGALADLAVGLAVAAVWFAPYALWPEWRPEPTGGFDPSAAGEARRTLMLGLRLVGFAGVTPFIEELLVRSFLMRWLDAYDSGRDFRELPIGRFAWRSFLGTTLWFTFTHAQWEWPVACVAGVVYNLWLYRRKHIGAVILAHAATNAALYAAVTLYDGDEWLFFL